MKTHGRTLRQSRVLSRSSIVQKVFNVSYSCAIRTTEGSTRQCGFPAKFIQHLALDVSQILNTPAPSASAFLLLASPRNHYHPGIASWCSLCCLHLWRRLFIEQATPGSNKVGSRPYSAIFRDKLCATLQKINATAKSGTSYWSRYSSWAFLP